MFKNILTIAVLFAFVLSFAKGGSASAGYNYDSLGDPVPSQAGYIAERTVTGADLGVGGFSSPTDIFRAYDGRFYIADSGNDRIVAADGEFTAAEVYDSFTMPDGSVTTLKTPSGVYVSAETKLLYIADTDNARVLVSDLDGRVTAEITKPTDSMYDEKKTFLPQRVIADKAGNVYVVLGNITTGAALFAPTAEGYVFSGFYGANRVQPTAEVLREHAANIFMSDEKRSRRTRSIPSGITSFDIDGDFIFTCTSSSTQMTDTVKKLNPSGRNIFADKQTIFGDRMPMYDTSQNRVLAPSIVDIDIDEDGNINCLDFTTGRIFQYDEDCELLFITGDISKQTGGFDHASAVESGGGRLFVTDSQKNTVTIFSETDFGRLVHRASALHNGGYYEEALEPWLEVLRRDGSYSRAYSGIAAAKLRSGDYAESMRYARAAYSQDIYNKAFEGWRLGILERYFGLFLAMFLIIAVLVWLRMRRPREQVSALDIKPDLRHVLKHPFEGFEDMRWKKAGSLKTAFAVVTALFLTIIAQERLSGFQFVISYDKTFNIVPYIVRSFVLFAAWTIGSRAVGTFLDGEGTVRNIAIYSAYALVPYVAQGAVNTLLSHVLILDEAVFMQAVGVIGVCWTAVLMFSAVKSVHQYSAGRTAAAIVLTAAAMLIMLFLLILLLSLFQQVFIFAFSIYTEITYRI